MASGDTDQNTTTASADSTQAAPSPDAPNQRGRPSIWTAELEARILADIRAGNSERVSAEANEVPYSTFRHHKDENEDFRTRCQSARAQGLREIATEYRTTDNPVRAKVCHHFLAVKDREEWAETQKVEHSGTIGFTDLVKRVGE